MNCLLKNHGQNDDYSEVWMEYIVQVRAAAITHDVEDILRPTTTELDRAGFWLFYEGAVTTASTLARQARRERSATSVALTQGEKARLGRHLDDLKAALNASSISEKLKANLQKRLEGFEAELAKERSNLSRIIVAASIVVTAISTAAVATLGTVDKAEDVITKVPATFDSIVKITGGAKTEEIERQPEQKALPVRQNPFNIKSQKLKKHADSGRRSNLLPIWMMTFLFNETYSAIEKYSVRR